MIAEYMESLTMKLLVVFVFAFFCLINLGNTMIPPPSDICTSDKDCGRFCYCIKQEHHYSGECQCVMDPYYLKTCYMDYDCIDESRGMCKCVKVGSEAGGHCKCLEPLLG